MTKNVQKEKLNKIKVENTIHHLKWYSKKKKEKKKSQKISLL